MYFGADVHISKGKGRFTLHIPLRCSRLNVDSYIQLFWESEQGHRTDKGTMKNTH